MSIDSDSHREGGGAPLELIDAIALVGAYAASLDARDFPRLERLLEPEVQFSFAGATPGVGASDLVQYVRRLCLADRSQHLLSVVELRHDGPESEVGVQGTAIILRDGRAIVRGLAYRLRVVRRETPRISALRQYAIWSATLVADTDPGALFPDEWTG